MSPSRRGWRRFRALPTKVQVIAWAVAALVALGVLGGGSPSGTDVVVAPAVSEVATEEPTREPTEEPAAGPTEELTEEPTEEPTRDATEPPVAAAAEPTEAPAPASPPAPEWTVTHIVDGDTIDVRSAAGVTERVRIVGIDTPERGECGFDEAAAALGALIQGKGVELVPGATDDRDRYGRVLRYVDSDGVDAGLELIRSGLAIARYDSRDGYGRHPREDVYVAADDAAPLVCAAPAPDPQPAPAPAAPALPGADGPGSGPGGAWKNCTEAREHGAAPVHRDDPGYGSHLDGDDDGVGCE